MKRPSFLQFYFSFEGNVTRKQFWLFFILPVVYIQLTLGLVLEFGGFNYSNYSWRAAEIVFAAIFIPLQTSIAWATFTVCSKRLQRSGLPRRMLLVALPGIGAIWVLAELLLAPDEINPPKYK
ncbi:DUF805 domain-containing protein [Microbulbifer sp. TRSA001]|uniref:DUF805 domain-containing protein n=1 Tax=unclassified Microbulbifer TaxID=2619833 RepID=UPI00333FADC9